MVRKHRPTRLPAPYLQRISLQADLPRPQAYPFDLPWLTPDFDLEFTTPVTIITGENGTGKSTLIEAIAGLCGFDEAGGGKGYRPVDHSGARDRSGTGLADLLKAAWLPKVSDGWFFRAETFFSVARYLDASGSLMADYLTLSHGEGFLEFFAERLSRQGLYLLDEPESALSPRRQMDLLRLLHEISETARAQVLLCTHSPYLMALPGARLLEVNHRGFREISYRDTAHFRWLQAFAMDPDAFTAAALADEVDDLI
ncbi:MAG: AAA family ATPase [Pseudomonadota bacterium]